MSKIIRENRVFFNSYAMLLIIIGVLQVNFSQTQLSIWVNSHHSPEADIFFKYFTYIGDGWFAVGIILVLCFFSYRWAVLAVLSFIVSALLAQFLKLVIFPEVVRPIEFLARQVLSLHLVSGVEMLHAYSFPSGHTTSAFAIFCLLTIMVQDKHWALPFLLLACLVGYSRVYLLQHFVADTFAGSLIGTFITLLIVSFLQKHWQQNPKVWLDKRLWSNN